MMITEAEMLLFYSLLKDELKTLNRKKEEQYAANIEWTLARIQKSWDRKNKRARSYKRLKAKLETTTRDVV